MTDGGEEGLKANEKLVPESELKEAQKRIRELERILGKQTVKVEILEEAVKVARKKVDLGRWLVKQGRWKVMVATEALSISRSSLYYRPEVRERYDKQKGDTALLRRIRKVIGKCPTQDGATTRMPVALPTECMIVNMQRLEAENYSQRAIPAGWSNTPSRCGDRESPRQHQHLIWNCERGPFRLTAREAPSF